MKLKQVQLHTPLFLGRTNLGDRLDTGVRAGLELEYKQDEGLIYITHNNEVGMVPISGIACMIAARAEKVVPIRPETKAPAAPVQAQVSTPTSHVFATESGVTGQGKP